MKMIKCQKIILTSALIALTSTIKAETFSYTFISAGYTIFNEEIDGINEDLEGDGVGFDLSLNIAKNFAITAGYATGSADVSVSGSTINADIDGGSVGAFFHTPVSESTDFIFGADFIRSNVDIDIDGAPFLSDTENGNSIYAGVRGMIAYNVELNAFIDRVKFDDSSSTDINLGASYYINKLFTLDAGYSFNKDGTSLSLGATKYF